MSARTKMKHGARATTEEDVDCFEVLLEPDRRLIFWRFRRPSFSEEDLWSRNFSVSTLTHFSGASFLTSIWTSWSPLIRSQCDPFQGLEYYICSFAVVWNNRADLKSCVVMEWWLRCVLAPQHRSFDQNIADARSGWCSPCTLRWVKWPKYGSYLTQDIPPTTKISPLVPLMV